MSGAISICANNETGKCITRLWDQAGMLEDKPSMAKLGYPPHFTFAIYEDIEIEHLEHAVHSVFSECGPISITFDRIKLFDSSPLVLWASPLDASALQDLHAAIHGLIDPARCHEHYRPGSWVPHCTLATGITEKHRSAAIDFATNAAMPFDVIFDAADWISFPPVELAGRLPLRSHQQAV
jgi:hypothetical protein